MSNFHIDAVQCMEKDGSSVGIIDSIVKFNICPCKKYLFIRRLAETSPAHGNEKVIQLYGHTRYKYLLHDDGDVGLAIVPISSVLHPLGIVIYSSEYTERHGHLTRIGFKGDSIHERRALRFFKVK